MVVQTRKLTVAN